MNVSHVLLRDSSDQSNEWSSCETLERIHGKGEKEGLARKLPPFSFYSRDEQLTLRWVGVQIEEWKDEWTKIPFSCSHEEVLEPRNFDRVRENESCRVNPARSSFLECPVCESSCEWLPITPLLFPTLLMLAHLFVSFSDRTVLSFPNFESRTIFFPSPPALHPLHFFSTNSFDPFRIHVSSWSHIFFPLPFFSFYKTSWKTIFFSCLCLTRDLFTKNKKRKTMTDERVNGMKRKFLKSIWNAIFQTTRKGSRDEIEAKPDPSEFNWI